MVSSTFTCMKLMILCALVCTFLRVTNTLPAFDSDDEEELISLDDPFYNTYFALPGRSIDYNRHQQSISPQNLFDDRQQQDSFHRNKQYDPENLHLFKRIIMLPRVGRRSVRSTSNN